MKKNIEILEDILCPPGNGVYTVHTAQDKKLNLQSKLYHCTNPREVEKKWKKSLSQFKSKSKVLLGIPSDCGGGIHRGANWGPLILREEIINLLNKDIFDVGDVKVIPHLLHDKYLNKKTISSCREALYQSSSTHYPVSPLSISELACQTIWNINPNVSLLSLGGDHSVSYPLLKVWLKQMKKQGYNPGILHFDAHTDLSDQRLGIDLCFGTWTSHILNYLDNNQALVQVGIRASAKNKSYWKKEKNIIQHWAHEVNQKSSLQIAQKIVSHYKKLKINCLYLTFDIDTLDSQYACATGTPESGGLTPHQCLEIIDYVNQYIPIHSADLVELAPFVSDLKYTQAQRQSSIMMAGKIAGRLVEIIGG